MFWLQHLTAEQKELSGFKLKSFFKKKIALSGLKVLNIASLELCLLRQCAQLNKQFTAVSEDLGKGTRQKLVWVAKRWRVSMFARGWWMRGAERQRAARSRVHLSQMEKDTKRKTQARRSKRSALVSITVSFSILVQIWLNSIWSRLKVSSRRLHSGPRGGFVCSGINLRECHL